MMLKDGEAYNLKKLLKYSTKLARSKAQSARTTADVLFGILRLIFELMFGPKWPKEIIPPAK